MYAGSGVAVVADKTGGGRPRGVAEADRQLALTFSTSPMMSPCGYRTKPFTRSLLTFRDAVRCVGELTNVPSDWTPVRPRQSSSRPRNRGKTFVRPEIMINTVPRRTTAPLNLGSTPRSRSAYGAERSAFGRPWVRWAIPTIMRCARASSRRWSASFSIRPDTERRPRPRWPSSVAQLQVSPSLPT